MVGTCSTLHGPAVCVIGKSTSLASAMHIGLCALGQAMQQQLQASRCARALASLRPAISYHLGQGPAEMFCTTNSKSPSTPSAQSPMPLIARKWAAVGHTSGCVAEQQ